MSAQPNNHLMTDADMQDENTVGPDPIQIKRVLHINIAGNLNTFGMDGPTAAQWKPLDGKLVDVLGPAEHNACHMNLNSTLSSLSTAVVKKAVMFEQHNNFPVPLGVSISCLPAEEVTDNGERFVCTVLPHAKVQTPQLLFESDGNNVDSLKWTQQYPGFNGNNLETNEVMDVNNAPYVFVRENHPAIALLRANKDLLGSDIDEQPKIDNEWFKVTKTVFQTCCNTLRKKILPRLNTKDLTKFSVQLHRLNGEDWDDLNESHLTGLQINASWDKETKDTAKTTYTNALNETVFSYYGRLELTYEIQP